MFPDPHITTRPDRLPRPDRRPLPPATEVRLRARRPTGRQVA